MTENLKIKKKNWIENFKEYLNETEISSLVFTPPLFVCGVFLICYLFETYFPQVSIPHPLAYFGLSLLFFSLSFSGIAEIFKREMPGPMGGIIKGKLAIISGIIIIIIPAIAGFAALIAIFSDILIK